MKGNEKQPQQTVYLEDSTTFSKVMYPSDLCQKSGQMPKNWTHERIMNEASAINIVRYYTAIPVPEVISVGNNSDGSSYVKTALIRDAIPVSDISWECSHATNTSSCYSCAQEAETNAAVFLKEVVIPQLSAIPKSCTTGLNGIVIPPPFVTSLDKRSFWPVKSSKQPVFAFIHGDLGPHNILVDKCTLQVACVIDWENGGYYPEVCGTFWTGSKHDYYKFYDDHNGLNQYISALLE